jgi:hypothetical protein
MEGILVCGRKAIFTRELFGGRLDHLGGLSGPKRW